MILNCDMLPECPLIEEVKKSISLLERLLLHLFLIVPAFLQGSTNILEFMALKGYSVETIV